LFDYENEDDDEDDFGKLTNGSYLKPDLALFSESQNVDPGFAGNMMTTRNNA